MTSQSLFSGKFVETYPVSMLYKSTAGCFRPVSYPDRPITARCRFIKNASWVWKRVLKAWHAGQKF